MILKVGSVGPEVMALQIALNKYGAAGVLVDGIFGTATRVAVIAFQHGHDLIGDGVVGPLTAAKIGIGASPPVSPIGTTKLKCFDVSHWEPNVDWKQAAAFGERVCISKATDGLTYVDDTFKADRAASSANGLVYMPYHFFRFNYDPAAQAEFMFKTMGPVRQGELAPCLDLEWDNNSLDFQYRDSDHGAKGTQGQINDIGAERALVFLRRIEELTGMTPFVYTAPGFFPGLAKGSTVMQFAKYPLWIANPGTTKPSIPSPWKDWTFWQYSFSGNVPGTGKIDVSWFQGDEAALQALVKK